jgi:uncharacterized protein (TIGR03437 family)
MDGFDYSGALLGFFGSTLIPAGGSLGANVSYRGVAPPFELRLTFRGRDSNGRQWTRQAAITLQTRAFVTVVSYGGLANGASFQTAFAPGMVASAFGSNLAAGIDVAAALPLPVTLAGTRLTVNGVAAPFYFASPHQLNFQIPFETAAGPAILRVDTELAFGHRETYYAGFVVSPSAPGIFAAGGKLVPFPAGKRGDTLILFITGDGSLNPPLATGRGPDPSTAIENLPKPQLPVSMTIGGVPATIVFAGVPPALAGVTQVNFTIDPATPLGDQPVVVTVGQASSAPVLITVQ